MKFKRKLDVFLSFRVEDTRNQFASYLYAAFSAKHISTFMDDHQLERGDEISSTLQTTIEESKIWVIFSENFASSTWCSNDLVHILERKKINEMGTVVRKQKGSYGVALAELEERFEDEDRMENVKQWRAALIEASNLCGLYSEHFSPRSS